MSNSFPYEIDFNFYEEGRNPHSIECGFYRMQCFSNIDIVNQTKLYVNVKGNYYKAYLQTKRGEHFEIELNTWVDLLRYYDSDKVNVIILFYPNGDLEDSNGIRDPIITANLSQDKMYYDITIRYRGHAERYYKTTANSEYQNYMGSFRIYENCTIYAQGRTGDLISNEVSLTLNEIDMTFTTPTILVSTTDPAESVVITVTNWGITDTQEIEIIPL